MDLERKFELSIYTYFRSFISSNVNVTDEEVEEDLNTPTVAFYNILEQTYPLELGGGYRDAFFWRVDCYCNTRTERDVLGRQVYNNLKCNIPVLDFDDPLQPQIGVLICSNITKQNIIVPTEYTDKLRYRTVIAFKTVFQED